MLGANLHLPPPKTLNDSIERQPEVDVEKDYWGSSHLAICAIAIYPVIWHIGSCPGTSEPQYGFGGIDLAALTGILKSFFFLFMVPGDTKFEPD